MAQVMPGLAPTAPSNRHDVISALLNDYGSSFRDGGNTSPYVESPIQKMEPIKELPLPPLKNEKPLPPVLTMRFQLRVDEAGTYGLSKNQKMQEQPTTIISRSISRSTKPPGLRLTTSNGSTAASSTSTSSSSTITPSYQDRPLPGLPPPPEKSHLRSEMGTKSSKVHGEKEQKAQSPKHFFKRRPLPNSKANGSKSYLTLADTISSLKPKNKSVATIVKGQANRENASSPSTSVQSSSVPSSYTQTQSDSTELSEGTIPTHLISRERFSTRGTIVELETPPTAELKPVLLPSPSPVPEESPSKYGIHKPASISSTETHNPPPAASKHLRGKSSTGFHIFKGTTATLQNASAYLNTITPSPTPSPIETPKIAHAQQARSRDLDSLASSLNAARPPSTSAPVLKLVHMECYHQHRCFHRSANRCAPVPCMLCYKDDHEERWTCSWCALRVCTTCRTGLERVPRRSVQKLLEMRESVGVEVDGVGSGQDQGSGVVVWKA